MDNKKIGCFIKKLREANNWSQEQLAEKLFVTRQAISTWETGKNIPDIEKFESISKLFKISITDLYAGEKLENKNQVDKVLIDVVKTTNNKVKKIIKVFLFSFIFLICSFLAYYFISSYKSIKVYLISEKQENLNISGLFLTSKEKMYLNVNISGVEVKNVDLVYCYNDENKTLYSTEDDIILYKENYGNNEYIVYDNINDIKNNLYLKVTDVNKKDYNVKLKLKKDFENNGLFFFKDEQIINNNDYVKNDIPVKIMDNFKLENDIYKYTEINNENKISMYYMPSTKIFGGNVEMKQNIYEWEYDVENKLINYYLYNIDYEQIDSYNGTFENAKQIFNDNLIKIINYIELYLS